MAFTKAVAFSAFHTTEADRSERADMGSRSATESAIKVLPFPPETRAMIYAEVLELQTVYSLESPSEIQGATINYGNHANNPDLDLETPSKAQYKQTRTDILHHRSFATDLSLLRVSKKTSDEVRTILEDYKSCLTRHIIGGEITNTTACLPFTFRILILNAPMINVAKWLEITPLEYRQNIHTLLICSKTLDVDFDTFRDTFATPSPECARLFSLPSSLKTHFPNLSNVSIVTTAFPTDAEHQFTRELCIQLNRRVLQDISIIHRWALGSDGQLGFDQMCTNDVNVWVPCIYDRTSKYFAKREFEDKDSSASRAKFRAVRMVGGEAVFTARGD